MLFSVTEHFMKTARHASFYLASGPEAGPLIIFVHGWPDLSHSLRNQLRCFGALGFRCVAPDMRGYSRSSHYTTRADYALEHSVDDMLELARSSRSRAPSGSATTGAALSSGTSPATTPSAARRSPISVSLTLRTALRRAT